MRLNNLLLVLTFPIIIINRAFSLEAVHINSKLPVAMNSMKAVYDGNDAIYLLGGKEQHYLNTIFRFSLSTEQIQLVDKFPGGISFGSAEFCNGNAMYFGGAYDFIESNIT